MVVHCSWTVCHTSYASYVCVICVMRRTCVRVPVCVFVVCHTHAFTCGKQETSYARGARHMYYVYYEYVCVCDGTTCDMPVHVTRRKGTDCMSAKDCVHQHTGTL